MLVVETHAFRRRIDALLSPEEFRELQLELIARPGVGDVIPGTAGLRKLRWAGSGRGKRGGLRIIYYLHELSSQLLLLFVFAKNERADLSSKQKAVLKRVVQEKYHES